MNKAEMNELVEYVLLSDMEEHNHPQYGGGFFCTPDAIKSSESLKPLTEQLPEALREMTAKEQIALVLWERFAPEHDIDPSNSLRGEYPLVADDVMKTLRRQQMTSAPHAVDHVRRLVMWLDVVEEIHGEFKGGAKEALEEAREFLTT